MKSIRSDGGAESAGTVPKTVVVGGRDVSLDIASKETEKTISPTGNEDIQNASVPCKSGSATAPTITASTPSAGRARMCVDGMNTSHNSTQIAFGSYDDDCLRVEKRPLPLPGTPLELQDALCKPLLRICKEICICGQAVFTVVGALQR